MLNSFDDVGEIKEAGGSGGGGGSDVAGMENGGGPNPEAGGPTAAACGNSLTGLPATITTCCIPPIRPVAIGWWRATYVRPRRS